MLGEQAKQSVDIDEIAQAVTQHVHRQDAQRQEQTGEEDVVRIDLKQHSAFGHYDDVITQPRNKVHVMFNNAKIALYDFI